MLKLPAVVLLLTPATVLAGTPSAATILANARRTSGGRAWATIDNLRITATAQGVPSVRLIDLRSGNMVTHTMGAVPSVSGVDGGASWYMIANDQAVAVQSPLRRKAHATAAYIASFGWWYRRRSPASISLVGQKTHGTKPCWILRITPDHGLPFTLWINARSMLVARTVERIGQFATIVNLSNYRSVHGVKLAFARQTIRVYNGRHVSDTRVQSVAVNVPIKAGAFAAPYRTGAASGQ